MHDNDNSPPRARTIPIVGRIVEDGTVVITDARWRPSPRPAPQLVEISRREIVVD